MRITSVSLQRFKPSSRGLQSYHFGRLGFQQPESTSFRAKDGEKKRDMTSGQRLELSLRMTDVQRRFTMLQRLHDLRNHNMRVAITRTWQDS
jgi:hypothetical protein